MDAVPFISVGSTNANMTNHLMHEKRRKEKKEKRKYDYRARHGMDMQDDIGVTCSSVPLVSIVWVSPSARLNSLSWSRPPRLQGRASH